MSGKVRLYHDPRIDQPEEITGYLHCQKCMDELPAWESPKGWARLNVGITATGAIQIWCTRHECNVDIIGTKKRDGLEYPDEPKPMKCAVCGEE